MSVTVRHVSLLSAVRPAGQIGLPARRGFRRKRAEFASNGLEELEIIPLRYCTARTNRVMVARPAQKPGVYFSPQKTARRSLTRVGALANNLPLVLRTAVKERHGLIELQRSVMPMARLTRRRGLDLSVFPV